MVEQEYANVFQKTIGTLTKQSIESIDKFRIGLGGDIIIFADVSLNGFAVRNIENTGSFSLGITIPAFK
jgi:hypothetical protein